jgi:signal transduction histidine kinase
MTERYCLNEDALRRKVVELSEATQKLEQAHERLIRSSGGPVGRLPPGSRTRSATPSPPCWVARAARGRRLTPEEERDFLGRLRRETERIHGILRDLLAFARPSVGAPRLATQPGDVSLAIEDVTALVAPQGALRESSSRWTRHRACRSVAAPGAARAGAAEPGAQPADACGPGA